MNRRLFLRALGIGTLGIAGGCSFSLEDGIFNPCLTEPTPKRLLDDGVVTASWQGIDPAKLWDCHVHIAGVGDGNTGVWITPEMTSPLHPLQNLQRRFYLNASCTEREGKVDEDFVTRLLQCLDVFPAGAKAMVLAFDFHYDEQGERREDLSAFFIPNRYAATLAQRFPDRLSGSVRFIPIAPMLSMNCIGALGQERTRRKVAPFGHGYGPGVAEVRSVLPGPRQPEPTSADPWGEEKAVHGASLSELNNPLRFRRPLDQGCESLSLTARRWGKISTSIVDPMGRV